MSNLTEGQRELKRRAWHLATDLMELADVVWNLTDETLIAGYEYAFRNLRTQPPRSLPVLSTVDEPASVFAPADKPLPVVDGGPSHPDGPAVPEISDRARAGMASLLGHVDARMRGYEDPAVPDLTDDFVADSWSDLAADDEARSV